MPVLTKEESKNLKAVIYDLDEKASRQILYGICELLEQHPSVLTMVFCELVKDGLGLNKWKG